LGEQFNSSGQIGINQTSIHAALDVNGGVRIGSDSTCNGSNVGELIYTSGLIEYCYNSTWIPLTGSGSGGGGSGSVIDLANGSAANPSLTFTEDTTTGLYQSSLYNLFVTTGGTEAAVFDSSGNFDLNNGSNTSAGAYQINATTILALPDNDTTSIAVGGSALLHQNATGYNTALGDLALTTITNGTDSTAVGYEALYKATGSPNTAVGVSAGEYITTGSDNLAIGVSAMTSTSAHPLTAANAGNIAIGDNALTAITGGDNANVAIGYNALTISSGGSPNTAIGYEAMQYATTSGNNTAIGNLAMHGNSIIPLNSGGQPGGNVAVGDSALTSLYGNSQDNTAVGYEALASQNIYSGSTAVGAFALNKTTGVNTAVGINTGRYITTGNDNIAIG
jgi:hypothetical protein